MDDSSMKAQEKTGSSRLFLPSLCMSNFAVGLMGVFAGLLLVDIALEFDVSIGIMGQISTLSYAVAVLFALFTGLLSVRFHYKTLIITGSLCFLLSATGCAFAQDFSLMLASYALSGIGTAMVFPMAIASIGELVPQDDRTRAVGWVIAASSMSFLIGAPLFGFLAGIMNWRFVILGFVVPVSLVGLFLAACSLPPARCEKQAREEKSLIEGFKAVFTRRSALACLGGNLLHTAAFMGIAFYGVSFLRQQFLMQLDLASGILFGGSFCYILGSLFASRMVARFGRIPVVVFCDFLLGVFTVSFFCLPILAFSIISYFFGALFAGTGSSAASSLTLEQMPKFRGATMSINSSAVSLGNAFGAASGGLIIVLFNYDFLGVVLGATGVVAALMFRFLAIDPDYQKRLTNQKQQSPPGSFASLLRLVCSRKTRT